MLPPASEMTPNTRDPTASQLMMQKKSCSIATLAGRDPALKKKAMLNTLPEVDR